MESLNIDLFLALNAGEGASSTSVHIATSIAVYLIYLTPFLLAGAWMWWAPTERGTLLVSVVAVLFGLLVNSIMRSLWYHPRPYLMGVGHTYLSHIPDSSFPSNHMTAMWAMAMACMSTRQTRIVGSILAPLAMLVGWARIYLGVHFPFDMFGAVAIGTLSVACGLKSKSILVQHFLPTLEWLYRQTFATAITKGWVRH